MKQFLSLKKTRIGIGKCLDKSHPFGESIFEIRKRKRERESESKTKENVRPY